MSRGEEENEGKWGEVVLRLAKSRTGNPWCECDSGKKIKLAEEWPPLVKSFGGNRDDLGLTSH